MLQCGVRVLVGLTVVTISLFLFTWPKETKCACPQILQTDTAPNALNGTTNSTSAPSQSAILSMTRLPPSRCLIKPVRVVELSQTQLPRVEFSAKMNSMLRKDYQRQRELEGRYDVQRNRRFPAPPAPISPDNPVLIYTWTGDFGGDLKYFTDPTWTSLCEIGCRFTKDKQDLPKAHIILYHQFIDPEVFVVRQPWQAVGLVTLEPFDGQYPRVWDFSDIDILISYSRYSEVRADYSYTFQTEDQSTIAAYLKERNIYGRLPNFASKRQDGLVVAVISNCGQFDAKFRLDYLVELAKHVEVHSYGSCMKTNVPLHMDRSHKSKIEVQGKYMFAFAFENSAQEDYVTEKFYEAMLSDAIPIYFGAPNIEDYTPDLPTGGTKSIIDAFAYPAPADLASLLRNLSKNETAYLEYFQWRLKPLPAQFGVAYNYVNRGRTSKFCRAAKWYVEHFTEV